MVGKVLIFSLILAILYFAFAAIDVIVAVMGAIFDFQFVFLGFFGKIWVALSWDTGFLGLKTLLDIVEP